MLGGGDDLALGHLHVLLAPRDDEHGLLPPDGGLDVGVCLGSQRLDLTTWTKQRCTAVLNPSTDTNATRQSAGKFTI